jgi:hypothetical protein
MESSQPEQEKTEKPRAPIPPQVKEESGAQISLVRKILIGLFIVGYWVFYYWFQNP